MSDARTEILPHAVELDESHARPRLLVRWLRRILLLIVSLWLIGLAITLAIEHTGLQRALTARVEAALGRPVEVHGYAFSFWGPVLEARSVTVSEDPRFGHEYFLRAETMTLRLRWQSLLRGRLELGDVSLTRPSLNLVRNSAGDWNLAEWLPRPDDARASASNLTRLSRISIDSGRINFKQGADKLPVAFVNVSGAVETDRPGRWRIDLDATPWRAAVILQHAGDLHLSGYLGGTSSRLRPALLDVSWKDASVSDVLRLVRGDDSGIRGELALTLTAHTGNGPDSVWNIDAHANLQQIHRWNLAFRPDNPSLNLVTQIDWNPSSPFWDFRTITVEAPRSNARASGRIFWNRDTAAVADRPSLAQFSLSGSQIDLADVLAWLRAFRAGISDGVSVHGLVSVRGDLSGSAPNLANASLSTDTIAFSGPALLKPVRVAQFELRFNKGTISSTPVVIAIGAHTTSPDGLFHVELIGRPSAKSFPGLHVSGSSPQVRALIAAAGAFGWNISRGWDLSGPFSCDLRWPSSVKPWREQTTGWLEFGAPGDARGASLTAPFLSHPIDQIRARMEIRPGDVRHILLTSAAAFGARWNGTFDRRAPSSEWQFALSADNIDAADLDRWLNPIWRENFLGRMLPFLVSHPNANAVPEDLRAVGALNVDDFNLGPLAVSGLKGTLAVQGRRVTFANASGHLFGGRISGTFDADLASIPSYRTSLDFSGIDLAALALASVQLPDVFSGSASGHAALRATGASRSDLLGSLECTGAASVSDAQLKNMNLVESLRESARVAGATSLEKASSNFSCHRREVQIQDLRFVHENGEIDASGSVDFGRNLDLRLRVLPSVAVDSDAAPAQENSTAGYRLTGTLDDPQIEPALPAHSRAGH